MAFVAGAAFSAPAFAQTVPSHAAPGGGIAGPVARVTWSNQIVRTLQSRCQTCHHDGGLAPFPLMTYAEAREHRVQMQIVTASRQMPPWHADSSCTAFAGDPSLSADEIRMFSLWAAAGAPFGDSADTPLPRTFPSEWSLGDPDQILAMAEPFKPDFSKGEIYRCFVFPTKFTEDRFLSALEVKPGEPAMVHHVLAFIDPTDAAERLDAADPGPGYTCFGGPGFDPGAAPVAAWAPGNQAPRLPDGVGIPVPRGSRIVIQVHYSPRSGVSAPDATSLGLHFVSSPPKKRWQWVVVLNTEFVLPAGRADVQVLGVTVLKEPMHAYAISPHMHLLGRTMKVDAVGPDGTRICLVAVPDWDQRWQNTYRYREGVALPAGTRLELVSTYDNSEGNANNPNSPPKDVRWGELTTDEMCLLYLHGTLDDENLSGAPALAPGTKETLTPFWEDSVKVEKPRSAP